MRWSQPNLWAEYPSDSAPTPPSPPNLNSESLSILFDRHLIVSLGEFPPRDFRHFKADVACPQQLPNPHTIELTLANALTRHRAISAIFILSAAAALINPNWKLLL